jgi:excisionase family DNA binding protein
MSESYEVGVMPLLTPEEVAETLVISPQSVRRLVERGELAAIRVSERRLRFTREDVAEYVTRRREAAIP